MRGTSERGAEIKIVRGGDPAHLRVVRPRKLEGYLAEVHALHLDPLALAGLRAQADAGDQAAIDRLIDARLELAALTALAFRTPDIDPFAAIDAANDILAQHVRARSGGLSMWEFIDEVSEAIRGIPRGKRLRLP